MIKHRQIPAGIKDMPAPDPLCVLALSGGGYRGLFAADVLARLNAQLGDVFIGRIALFAGTSVGGLIAAGLAIGRSPEQIRDAILDHGPVIFDDRVRICSKTLYRKFKGPNGGLLKSKFNAKALDNAIEVILGDKYNLRVGEVDRPLMLVATCATSRSPFLMSSLRPNTPGNDMLLKDALRATSAAPGFFPAFDLHTRTLLDGGLVANAPEIVACAEMLEMRRVEIEHLRILSIGTAAPDGGAVPAKLGRRGLLFWLLGDLVPLTLDAQEKLIVTQAATLLRQNYVRINPTPAAKQGKVLDLDSANDEATNTLQLLAEQTVTPAVIQDVKSLFRL